MRPNPHLMKKKELVKYMTGRCKHCHTYAEHPNCWFLEQNKKPRVGYIDIETSNLDANYGIIITYCIYDDMNNSIIENTINLEDIRKGLFDKNLCIQLIEDILKFDILKGYYSTLFDIPFIRSRCLKWKLNFPIYKTIDHKDIYYMVKRLLKLNKNSLEVAARFLKLPGEKTHVDGDTWMQSLMCDGKIQKESLKKILDHNREDVILTRNADYQLKEFDRGIVKSI